MSDDLPTAINELLAARTADRIYQTTVDAATRLLDADKCKLAIAENDRLVIAASSADDPAELGTEVPLTHGIPGRTYTLQEPYCIDDLADVRSGATEPARASSADCQRRYRSLVSIPLETVGVLVAVARPPAAFDDDDLAVAEELGSYAVTALERIRTTPVRRDGGPNQLERIASILSHDIKNPLFTAHGYVDLARETGEDEYFDRITTSLERAEELIDGVVTLARTGEYFETTEPVELRDAVERAWTTVSVNEATIEVEESASVMANEHSLCQLLENLFANAVEYNDSPVTVRIGLLDDGFYIEDDGPGIPEEDREQVFEWGYSSSDERTGIGLSIVEQIATAHGWTVAVAESDDGGARFEITGVEFSSGR